MKTLRQEIMTLLAGEQMSVRDLSKYLKINEKDVYTHLRHVERTVAASGKSLSIKPSRCFKCGYLFKNRRRLTRPSRCPQCRSTHLESPLFSIC
jgi:predicted Zn-ribbon and HTH transcriptional regulator